MSADANLSLAGASTLRLTYEGRDAEPISSVKCPFDKSRAGACGARPAAAGRPAQAPCPGLDASHPSRSRVPALPALCTGLVRSWQKPGAFHGAQTSTQSPEQYRTRASRRLSTIRSAGVLMAGRSRPARPGTPGSAIMLCMASIRQGLGSSYPHTTPGGQRCISYTLCTIFNMC